MVLGFGDTGVGYEFALVSTVLYGTCALISTSIGLRHVYFMSNESNAKAASFKRKRQQSKSQILMTAGTLTSLVTAVLMAYVVFVARLTNLNLFPGVGNWCHYLSSINAELWLVSKYSMYLVLVARVHTAYHGSAFRYSDRLISSLYISIVVCALLLSVAGLFKVEGGTVATGRKNNGQKVHGSDENNGNEVRICVPNSPASLNFVTVLLDLVFNTIIATMFVLPLRKLTKQSMALSTFPRKISAPKSPGKSFSKPPSIGITLSPRTSSPPPSDCSPPIGVDIPPLSPQMEKPGLYPTPSPPPSTLSPMHSGVVARCSTMESIPESTRTPDGGHLRMFAADSNSAMTRPFGSKLLTVDSLQIEMSITAPNGQKSSSPVPTLTPDGDCHKTAVFPTLTPELSDGQSDEQKSDEMKENVEEKCSVQKKKKKRYDLEKKPSEGKGKEKEAGSEESFSSAMRKRVSLLRGRSQSESTTGRRRAQTRSEREMFTLPFKYLVLTSVAVISTLLTMVAMTVTHLAAAMIIVDVTVNIVCLVFMTRYWSKQYWHICAPLMRCVGCCFGCCLSEEMIADVNSMIDENAIAQ